MIPKKPNLTKNAIVQQAKQSANSLTIQEWNEVVNVLRTQTNATTDYLEALHRTLFYDYDPNTTGILDYGVGALADALNAIATIKYDVTSLKLFDEAIKDIFKFNTTTIHEEDIELTFSVDGVCEQTGYVFYDNVKHTLVVITDLGEFHEIGSNLGDVAKFKNIQESQIPNPDGTTTSSYLYEGMAVTLTGVQGSSPIKECGVPTASNPNISMVGVVTTTRWPAVGYTSLNEEVKISVFGDINVPVFEQIIEGCGNADDIVTAYNNQMGAVITSATDIPQGTKLYLSATHAGKYSFVEPPRPYEIIWVASVLDIKVSNDTANGRIYVYPQTLRDYGASILHYALPGELPDYADPSDMVIEITEE